MPPYTVAFGKAKNCIIIIILCFLKINDIRMNNSPLRAQWSKNNFQKKVYISRQKGIEKKSPNNKRCDKICVDSE